MSNVALQVPFYCIVITFPIFRNSLFNGKFTFELIWNSLFQLRPIRISESIFNPQESWSMEIIEESISETSIHHILSHFMRKTPLNVCQAASDLHGSTQESDQWTVKCQSFWTCTTLCTLTQRHDECVQWNYIAYYADPRRAQAQGDAGHLDDGLRNATREMRRRKPELLSFCAMQFTQSSRFAFCDFE